MEVFATRKKRAGHVANVLFAACLAGCTSTGAHTESSQSLADQALFGPIEWQASEERSARCMRKEGFKYFPVPFVNNNALDKYLTIPMSRQELDLRRRVGYGVAERQRKIVASQTNDKNALYVGSLSEAESKRYTVLLLGDLIGGKQGVCRKPATSAELARLRRPLRLSQEARSRFVADSEVTAIGVKWKQCMSKRGYSGFQTPWDLKLGELVDVLSDGYQEALSKELAIARADSDCLSRFFEKLNRKRKEAERAGERAITSK
jgi:hypothetical protein